MKTCEDCGVEYADDAPHEQFCEGLDYCEICGAENEEDCECGDDEADD